MTIAVAAGLFGKLPARADFVCRGLPRDFTDPWDGWLSSVLSATREKAGAAWLPAFLKAPVWRFMLPSGLCGGRTVLGLFLPSVDAAGRYFPLTFAAVFDTADRPNGAAANVWLDGCEDLGRAALAQDLDPDAILAGLNRPVLELVGGPRWVSAWWTERDFGGTGAQRMTSLPDDAAFARMLGLSAQFAKQPSGDSGA